jgi:hypothetical protein
MAYLLSKVEVDSNDIVTENCVRDMLKSKEFNYKGMRYEDSENGEEFVKYLGANFDGINSIGDMSTIQS